MGRVFENNNVSLAGVIQGEFTYDHEVFGEKFYVGNLAVRRLSGEFDYVPLLASEKIIVVRGNWDGAFVKITGSFRTYNRGFGKGMVLSVFVNEIERPDIPFFENRIEFDGYICKTPILRKTPKEEIDISDVIIAVNRPYGKSDYFPCIAWGRNARYTKTLNVGTRLKACGRIQSREYWKHISGDESEKRIAHEISISTLEVVEG